MVFAQTAPTVTPGVTPSVIPSVTPSGTPAPDNNQAIHDLESKIQDLQSKISDLRGQEETLSSQIGVMDSQIKLTELRISSTKQQILDLTDEIVKTTKRIGNLEGSLNDLTKILMNRIVTTYEMGTAEPLQILLSSNTASDFFTRRNYLKIARAHDQQLMYDTVQAKNDYATQKALFEDKKKKVESLQAQLEAYTNEINQQKDQKQKLLSDTQGSEANYQRLLAQAKAQLAGFSSFVENQGGASILSNQTFCDGWGCYYNQRDSQWGNSSLNGTRYTIASDGCLVTSMAMVMTHYGHHTTPLDINANPDNFASYYPAYLLYSTTASGVTAKRIGASIDATLNDDNHDPVIVGVHAYGGTHFVVLKSGGSGDYIMNDPYLENGHDISFNAHYTVGSIFEIDKVVIQ